jgi:hypothetical protein
MRDSAAAFLIPLIVAFVIAGGLRLALGADRSARFVGLAVPLAFLLSWAAIVHPGWLAYDAVGRIGHIVSGAMVLGAVLDVFPLHRAVVLALGTVFLAACAWAEFEGGFWPGHMPSVANLLIFAGLIALAGGVLWRIDALRRREQPHLASSRAALIQLVMLALSLAAVSAASADAPLRAGALILAAALGGFLVVTFVFTAIRDLALPTVIVLTSAATLLAIAWALCERTPRAIAGVALSGLILFAEGTVRRIPLPKAGISRILYPLLLGLVGLAPLALATAITVALRAP